MCLYEPINGSFPTDSFCEMHSDCRSCGYYYNENDIDEAQRDYEAAADYQQYCEMYEPTYDPDTCAM